MNSNEYEWHKDTVFNRLWNSTWRIRSQKTNNNFTYLFNGAASGILAIDNRRQTRNRRARKNKNFLGTQKHQSYPSWARPSKRSLKTIVPSTAALIRKRLWDQTLIGAKNTICVNRYGEFYVATTVSRVSSA